MQTSYYLCFFCIIFVVRTAASSPLTAHFYLGDNFPNTLANGLYDEYIEVQITKYKSWTDGELYGEVYEGDTIVVTCYSFADKKIQYQELYLEQDGNVTKKLNHTSSFIGGKTITKYSVIATRFDSGEYTCHFPPRFHKQQVNVLRAQYPILKQPHRKNQTLVLGSTGYVECEIEEGSPEPTYEWEKQWIDLKINSRILTIQNVKLSDAGKYKCAATNRAGGEYYSINVNVVEKPAENEREQKILLTGVTLLVVLVLSLSGLWIYRKWTARYLKIKNDEEIAASMKFSPNIRIKSEKLKMLEKLGDGNFGIVEAGILEINKNLPHLNVAVKSPRTAGDILQTSMINEEYEIMKGIRLHPNILTLIGGVCDMENNTTISKIVFELCEFGSLSDYLPLKKYNSQKNGYNDKVEKCKEQLSFAYQVASGMEYISRIPCVHRDLAARNVLLKSNKICRIADFGLTRLHENKDYYRARYDCEIPIRWMSIESITESRYTQKSDVWSFGIVLFEIFSLGEKPYPNIESENIQKYIIDGNINDKPQDCHPIIYELMKKCWRKNPKKRPEFTECVKFFEKCFMSNFPDRFVELQSLIQSETDKQQNMDSLFDY